MSVSCEKNQGAIPPVIPETDVVIVGAGISGLSAAYEAARNGTRVTVVDMFSVFGGHAVMSEGGLCIVGTPTQEKKGITDTPEKAFNDFMTWGEDADSTWVRFYVNESRTEIYDWLTGLGITFDGVSSQPGNSVPRFHSTTGRGLNLVSTIYRECLKNPDITFRWNTKIDSLMVKNGRVSGVYGTNIRNGESWSCRAGAVILATGGFQSNLDLVREYWPQNLPFPGRMLIGSGINSTGSGLGLAEEAGGTLFNMDHQWNYVTGLPDPRFPGENRGLNAQDRLSIWVNAQGNRFVNEWAGTKTALPALLAQNPATYWAVFDEPSKQYFFVSGSDWGEFKRIQTLIFDNPALVKTAPTIEKLAEETGLPPDALVKTVNDYNTLIGKGADTDFRRFGPGINPVPTRIQKPPFYAVQFFPLSRKSMGGVRIDSECRVVDVNRSPIHGLYAVGELTGLAGINGSAALEGTFLGPSILTGKVAGRTVLADLAGREKPLAQPTVIARQEPVTAPELLTNDQCLACHNLPALIASPLSGYRHFEEVHTAVLDRKYSCIMCHAELGNFHAENPETHRIDRMKQSGVCVNCHVAEE